MLINTGVVYKFSFLTEFSSLDGIYLIDKILTYNETVSEGIDLFKSIYEPFGLTQNRFDSDMIIIRTDRILKLTNKNIENKIVYIPYSLCKIVPDPNIKKYFKLVIDLNLGVFDNVDRLNAVSSIMQEHISAFTGITNTPSLTKYGEIYLTEDEYTEIENNRDNTIKKVINYFTESVKLRKENERLKTIISGYEEKFMELNNP